MLHLVRSAVLWFLAAVFTVFFALISCLFGLVFRSERLAHKTNALWSRTISFCCGLRLDVENRGKLHAGGPVILLSNHPSMVDTLVVYNLAPFHIVFMSKPELFRIPFFGWAMKAAGYIAVSEKKEEALGSLFAAAREIKNGKSINIFPEGERSPAGGLHPLKIGAFILAKKAGVVLQPVTIWGSEKIIPYEPDKLMQRLYPGRVRVIVHDPIFPEEYANMPVRQLAEKIGAILEEPMERLRALS